MAKKPKRNKIPVPSDHASPYADCKHGRTADEICPVCDLCNHGKQWHAECAACGRDEYDNVGDTGRPSDSLRGGLACVHGVAMNAPCAKCEASAFVPAKTDTKNDPTREDGWPNTHAEWQAWLKAGDSTDTSGTGTKKYGYAGQGYQTTYLKSCYHRGEKPVISLGHVDLHAIQKSVAWTRLPDFDLVLDCSNSLAAQDRIVAPTKFQALTRYLVRPDDTIYLPWPDRGAPCVTFPFWGKLLSMIEPRADGQARLVVTCLGAHGRTGTALAALIMAHDPTITASKAVDLVRDKHCQEAVESKSQVDYLVAFEDWLKKPAKV